MKRLAACVGIVALAAGCGDPLALENADGLTGSITYADESGQLGILDLPGGTPHWITSSPGTKSWPRWSPDGQHLAFVSDSAGAGVLCLLDTSGAHLSRLVAGGFIEAPSWSPDGTRLAFARLDVTPGGIMLINADGSGLRNLAQGRNPNWSPAGDFIVFEDSGAVVRIGVDGSGRARLSPLNGGSDAFSSDRGMTVSPDGTRIAFIRDSAGTEMLHVMSADGSGDIALFDRPQSLTWSPSGTMIAFVRIDGGGWSGPDAAIHVIGADGTNQRRIIGLTPWEGMDWR